MKYLSINQALTKLIILILILSISGSVALALDQSDEELKKKYAPIMGEYEFDLTSMGGQVQYLTFDVKEGDLWIDSGDGDPATMEPVEGADFEFTANSSDGQSFEIKFVKDEQGEYTICKILVVARGVEIEGKKIKK